MIFTIFYILFSLLFFFAFYLFIAHLNFVSILVKSKVVLFFVFFQLLNNHICHINRAIDLFAKTSNMDRLLILTEWARLFGFSMSKEAEKLFIVQVLSKLDEP